MMLHSSEATINIDTPTHETCSQALCTQGQLEILANDQFVFISEQLHIKEMSKHKVIRSCFY